VASTRGGVGRVSAETSRQASRAGPSVWRLKNSSDLLIGR